MTISDLALKPTMGGQITRIRLENFMTYELIEVRPGYHLNLIIGPNGTGKSSIVCAVVLGLGGKTKTLARGDQLSSYVKSGCDQSLIEIELYNGADKSVVIRRQISSSNQSQFYVNNATATVAKINEIRKEFNIQIDNLCTFLPQEKVQDFAKLNPQQLLEQTEQTVGSGKMIQSHEDLKKLRANILDNERHIASLVEQHESEVQKNARIEDKVNSIREKQSLNDRLTLLNQKKAWLSYEEEITRKKEIDEDCKLAQKAFDEKRRKIDQVTRELKNLEDSIKDFQQKAADCKREEAGKKAVVDDRLKRAERRIEALEDLDNVIQARIAEEETKKQEMRKYEQDVDKLENDLRTLIADIGPEDRFNQKEAQISRELNEAHMERKRLDQTKADLEEDEMRLMHEARNAASERQVLERRRNARLEYLRRNEPDIYRGIEWLKENEGLFRGKIYSPMLLELDVPDPQMAKFVESRINYRDLISFTCTNPEDMNLLIKKLRTEMKLRINAVCSDEEDYTQYSPEVPIERLRPLGFYCYLKDLMNGPEPVVRYLCKTYRIHSIPVGDDTVKAKCGQVPMNINVFYSTQHVFNVKVSSYSGDKSTSVRKLSEAKFFNASVDERKIKQLLELEENIKQTILLKQQEITDINSRVAELNRKMDEIKKRKQIFATRNEEKNRINLNLKRARTQVDGIKKTLKDPAAIYAEAEKERESLRKQIERSLKDLKEANENLDKALEKRREAEIIFKTSRSGIDELMESKQRLAEEVRRAQETVSLMKERQRTAQAHCNELKEAARKATNGVGVGDRGFKKYEDKFKELPKTIDDLEREIEETQAKADFLIGGSSDLLKEYERREETIAQLGTTIDTGKKELEKKKENLTTLRDSWLNPVTELIGKINRNFENFFETMGCAGEVVLLTPDNENDYDQYGIKIRVKFRDEVPLQDLSRHFQSGGERAVATAIYMLSLQELTSVPFRFVDEINQGMDPANERRIIDLIMKATAPVESTQYFFITPKLLSDIHCSKTMSVLCIYNGPTAIPTTKWNLGKFLKRAKGGSMDNSANGNIDGDLEEEEY